MLQQLANMSFVLRTLAADVRGGRVITPFEQCQFEVYEDNSRPSVTAHIEQRGLKVHRLIIENEQRHVPKLPCSELASIYAPFFAEILSNLSEGQPWVCRMRDVTESHSIVEMTKKVHGEGQVIWTSAQGDAGVFVAKGKALENILHTGLQETLIDSTLVLPKPSETRLVASLLQVEGGMTQQRFIQLLDHCDYIVAKDVDGYALALLSQLDHDRLTQQGRVEEVGRRFRKYVKKGLSDFEHRVAPYWQKVLHLAETIWELLKASQGLDQDTFRHFLSKPCVREFLEMQREYGTIQGWEFLAARLRDDRTIRLLYEVYMGPATVWVYLEVTVPEVVAEGLWVDTIIVFPPGRLLGGQ